MLYVSKSELMEELLQILRRVEETGEEVVVTDEERPVARISPVQAKKKPATESLAEFRGKILFSEDPDTPTIDEWPEV